MLLLLAVHGCSFTIYVVHLFIPGCRLPSHISPAFSFRAVPTRVHKYTVQEEMLAFWWENNNHIYSITPSLCLMVQSEGRSCSGHQFEDNICDIGVDLAGELWCHGCPYRCFDSAIPTKRRWTRNWKDPYQMTLWLLQQQQKKKYLRSDVNQESRTVVSGVLWLNH